MGSRRPDEPEALLAYLVHAASTEICKTETTKLLTLLDRRLSTKPLRQQVLALATQSGSGCIHGKVEMRGVDLAHTYKIRKIILASWTRTLEKERWYVPHQGKESSAQ